MNSHPNSADREARRSWVAFRRMTLVGVGVLIGASAVWLAMRPEPKITDRYSMVYTSILEAEKLAKLLHLKSPDRQHPTLLSDLHSRDEGGFKDAWGRPLRCAAVADPAGNEPDIYVWTDWVQDDGRIILIGARVAPDGKSTMFGLPPKD